MKNEATRVKRFNDIKEKVETMTTIDPSIKDAIVVMTKVMGFDGISKLDKILIPEQLISFYDLMVARDLRYKKMFEFCKFMATIEKEEPEASVEEILITAIFNAKECVDLAPSAFKNPEGTKTKRMK